MIDDRDSIRRALDGEHAAFDDLVRRYQDGLYRHLLRLAGRPEEAEDLCQEAFIRFYGALRRFDRARPVAPFLFAIATNLWRERARKGHLQEQPLAEHQPASGASVAEQAVLRLERGQILAAVAGLRPEQREALSLYYDQGLSYREIARITRAPMGTVSTRLRRALDALRRALGPEAAGLVIVAGGQDPLGTILIPALQAQGAAPSSLAPAIAHGIAHAAPVSVGLLHGVVTLWKEAGLMVKGLYVALGLAVVGGATVGVPRLIRGNGAAGVKQAAAAQVEALPPVENADTASTPKEYTARVIILNVTPPFVGSGDALTQDDFMAALSKADALPKMSGDLLWDVRFLSDLKARHAAYDFQLVAAGAAVGRPGDPTEGEFAVPQGDGGLLRVRMKAELAPESSADAILTIEPRLWSGEVAIKRSPGELPMGWWSTGTAAPTRVKVGLGESVLLGGFTSSTTSSVTSAFPTGNIRPPAGYTVVKSMVVFASVSPGGLGERARPIATADTVTNDPAAAR